MNLETLNRDRILSSITGEELCDLNKKIDKFFDELFNGMIIETYDHSPDSIFFVKKIDNEVKFYMKQDSKYNRLWCDYDLIWSFFEEKIGFEYSDTQTLIKERVEEAFKLRVNTPWEEFLRSHRMVEEAFKLRVNTPRVGLLNIGEEVEVAFKLKVDTPIEIKQQLKERGI